MPKNRLCLCVFWDKKGIVRDFVTYYLKELKEITNKLYVIVNGEINDEGRKKLIDLGVEILQRENKGFDFGAWKYALEQIGYDEVQKYDELIITNTTCYGPIYSFNEMFEEMESRDCDFWGVTKHPAQKNNIYKKWKFLEHIQSYFVVFNKNVFSSEAFKIWWKKVKNYDDYNKVAALYEVQMTNYFENNGFKSDSFIDVNKNFNGNPIIYLDEILQTKKIPLIKRKAIISDYYDIISYSLTHRTNLVLDFIKKHTNYDINFIYDDIVNTHKMSDIKTNLHLNYVLPFDYEYSAEKSNQKIALILHIYYEDLIDYCFSYAKSMPDNTDIYIVSPKETVLDICKEKANMLNHYNLIYRLKENRGRDVSAYLVTCKDVFENYDLICCMHDKKSPHVNNICAQDFSYQCFECNLKSKEYVSNVINLFNSNERIGLLTNPILKFAQFINLINNEIRFNEIELKKLFEKLNLIIPFDEHPVAPFGSMFWIRKEAIKPLFRHNWQYEDFPEEPLPTDGTISHAIERIYPSVAQEAGYLSAWIMPNDFAKIYLDNILYDYMRIKEERKAQIELSFLQKMFSIKNTTIFDKKYKKIIIFNKEILIKKNCHK